MSNQSQANRAKPIDDGVVGGKRRKRDKPIVVESRWSGERKNKWMDFLYQWSTYGKYRDLDTAKKVIEQQLRKCSYIEYRVK